MAGDLNTAIARAREALDAGDPTAAWRALQPALTWPASGLEARADVQRAMGALFQVLRAAAGPELAAKVQRVVALPDDPGALYDAAYALYEAGLHGVAATLLSRANQAAPGQPRIVTELASCLEALLAYGAAALVLDLSGLPDQDPICAYLSGYNHLMAGDLDAPRARVAALAGIDDGPIPEMRDALAAMVARADALQAAGLALDDRALTAWQAVVQGTVLLHASPHGHPDPMRGRYAYLGDSPGLMREGLDRLAAVLQTRARPVDRVVAAPGRASGILARAAGRHLDLPVVPWDGQGRGLVVAWSLEDVGDEGFYRALHPHHPDQVLFVHASSWVQPFPYAPDVTTLLHQMITHPYTGGAMQMQPDGAGVAPAEPDARDDDALAAEILAAEVTDASVTALDHVVAVASAVADLPEPHRGGLHRTAGLRARQRAGGPVPSARFT